MEHADWLQPDVATLESNLDRVLRERRPPPLLPGSQLATLIDDALGKSFREFFPPNEVPRLRTFVERYISPKLVQFIGKKQGADNMFSIPAEASTVELAHEGSLWKSFVAVKPTGNLVFNPETALVAVLSPGLPIPEDCVAVAPVTMPEHREFMKAFCKELEDDGFDAEQFRAIAEGPEEGLYQSWLAALRGKKPLDRTWGLFRRNKILELFEARLRDAGAGAERSAQLRRELEADHDVARAPKVVAAASLVADVASGATVSTRDQREKRARDLLKRAADRLTYEQLLSVPLPLGVVLDLTGHHPGIE